MKTYIAIDCPVIQDRHKIFKSPLMFLYSKGTCMRKCHQNDDVDSFFKGKSQQFDSDANISKDLGCIPLQSAPNILQFLATPEKIIFCGLLQFQLLVSSQWPDFQIPLHPSRNKTIFAHKVHLYGFSDIKLKCIDPVLICSKGGATN